MDTVNIPGSELVSDATEGLTTRSTYAGVAGVVVANVIGATLVMIPFYKLGRAIGNTARIATTLGLGGLLTVRSSSMPNEDWAFASLVSGVILVGYGVGQSLALLGVPGLRSIGNLMLGPDASAAEEIAQSGSGRVIGQEGINPDGTAYSFSDIKNAEGSENSPDSTEVPAPQVTTQDAGTTVASSTSSVGGSDEPFVAATLDLMNRGMGEEPMYSHTVPSPLGHGVAFNLGAEDITASPSGGVDQDFGGVPESSTTASPVEESIGSYVNSVDVGGAFAEGLSGTNPFVNSRYPTAASTQPPVAYGAETHDIPVAGHAISATQGSVYDEFGTYMKPGTSAEADPYSSWVQPSAGDSGRGVTFYFAEGVKTGTMGRQVVNAEGVGSVMGQMS